MSNVIFIKFYSKSKFPAGKWNYEPDYCKWTKYGLTCIALRDMSLGIWKGFVALPKEHPCYGRSVDDILKAPFMIDAFFSVYGGICSAGYLPDKYEQDAKKFWWVGCETSHGGDLYPLLEMERSPEMNAILSQQTYKDLKFIRRETNKLAMFISRIK